MPGGEARTCDPTRRWAPPAVPRPPVALPLYALVAGLVVAPIWLGVVPQALYSLLILPIPLLSVSWPRPAAYGLIAIFGAGAYVLTLDDAPGTLQRVGIQMAALVALNEIFVGLWRARDRALRVAEASERRYRAHVEGTRVIPWEMRLEDWAFTYVGPQAVEMLGYPLESWYAPGFWRECLLPADREATVRTSIAAASRGEDHEVEYRMRAADGCVVWIRSIVSIVQGPDGPAGLLGVMVDVTAQREAEIALRRAADDRRALEARALESQKLESLGRLAGGVAHDFNNLLTPILGNVTTVLDDLPADHPQRPALESAGLAAERAADLVQQMLAYAGGVAPEERVQDLREVVRETARMLASVLAGRARVELDLPDAPVWVRGGAAQLHQVVLNLISNAADAIESPEGRIRVRAALAASTQSDAGRQAVLQVRDDGAGMDLDTQRQIFEPFFSTRFTGRGLGMAAVHGIVRAHDGSITVDSEPGRGTSVTVYLPLSSAPRELGEPMIPADGPGASLRGCRVLVVDDEPSVRAVASRCLRAAGVEVSEAPGGHRALELLADDKDLDAVLLDMTMPDLSGEETLRRLRQIRPQLPVLRVSGFEDRAGADGGAPDDRATAFLQKPFRAADLTAALARLLPAGQEAGAEAASGRRGGGDRMGPLCMPREGEWRSRRFSWSPAARRESDAP